MKQEVRDWNKDKWQKMTFRNSFVPSVIGLILFLPLQLVLSLFMGDISYVLALGLVWWGVKAYLRRKGIK